MPQLDLLTFFSQIIWLLITFITLYIVSARIIIPSISKSLITRRLLLKERDSITSKGSNNELNSVQDIEKSLHSDIELLKSLVSEIKSTNINRQRKDTDRIVNQILTPINKNLTDLALRSKIRTFAYIKRSR